MQLIVIAGKARVGKTTLAKIIAEKSFELGFIPKLMSFASPIKECASKRGLTKEDNPEKYRKFCQELGQSKREEDPNYWVDILEKNLLSEITEESKDLDNNKKYWERCVIIDDCRYLNEIEFSEDYDATTIFINSGKRDIPSSNSNWRNHHSEDLANKVEGGHNTYRDLFTHIISNNKEQEDLENLVNPLIPVWLGINPPETARCQCESCRATREDRMIDMDKCIQELVDLLFMFDLEEEDEDEET